LYVKYNDIVASGAQNVRVVLTDLPKPMVWIGLLNPRANVSGFGHVSLQKSSTQFAAAVWRKFRILEKTRKTEKTHWFAVIFLPKDKDN